MRNLLEEPREISLGGKSETFRNYAYLAERGEIFMEMMQKIERELDADPDNAAANWGRLVEIADILSELLTAQEKWLADHDAAIAAEMESVRRDIRSLDLPSGTNGPGDRA